MNNKKIIFCIDGMHCQSCANRIETALNNKVDIFEANVNFANEEAQIIFNSKQINAVDIINIIKKLGFNASVKNSFTPENKKNFNLKLLLICIIAIVFIVNMIGMIFVHKFLPIYVQFILATIVQFILGFDFYKSSYNCLKDKIANMDVLVALSTTSIWAYSTIIFFFDPQNSHNNIYFEANVMIIAFISIGKYLESTIKKSSLNSIKLMMQLLPKQVKVLKNDKFVNINYSDIRINDKIKSNQGERISADGKVLDGNAWVDESHLTGEANFLHKKKGDIVLAGTLVNEGSLTYQAQNIKEKTFLGDIMQTLNQAQGTKANIAKIADKIAQFFVPIIIIIAILTFITTFFITHDIKMSIKHASAVLIISCPCALGIATPASIMVGLGLATKCGLLFKDAKSMETCAKIKAIVFDKTGTLTQGQPKIIDFWINNTNEYDVQELLKYAACAEVNSSHPIAKAIVHESQNNNIKFLKTKSIKNFIGYGITVQTDEDDVVSVGSLEFCNFKLPESLNKKWNNNTIVAVKLNNNIIGLIALSDDIRNDTKNSISQLKKLGIEIFIMSGDKKSAVDYIANKINISNANIYYNMNPKNKLEEIDKLLMQEKFVAMVGDGINDTLALTKATIGFSMQNGSDIANNCANIILMRNSIAQIYDAILISKATLKNIKQNLFFAFIYNILAIPLAAFGLLNPIIASISMTLSSITVLFNSLRLKNFKIS